MKPAYRSVSSALLCYSTLVHAKRRVSTREWRACAYRCRAAAVYAPNSRVSEGLARIALKAMWRAVGGTP